MKPNGKPLMNTNKHELNQNKLDHELTLMNTKYKIIN